MSLATAAVYRNNIVVAYIKAKDFENAIEVASLALRCHRAFQVNILSQDSCKNDASDITLDHYMLQSDMCERSEKQGARTMYTYESGIRLPPSVTDTAIIAPILIFNAALAFHLFAERQYEAPSSRVRLLEKAKRMYELAFRAQQCTDENMLFEFAILNNVAVIEHKIGDKAEANKYFEYLLSVLMMFVDQGCHLRLRHLQGFLLNIPPLIKAAKAA
ncbi:unnamed protein product [Cylindrotheca closterium]|uniref:Uncharacterized protein n=1 Tax=Cylindrotheca closterium TaxID=2856 RepID=A0AAD2G6M8_9STRA|nr:unnamed protein product [Cylindrotheca closterium]